MPHEVFISYARSDNVPEDEGTGWVTVFTEKLKKRLLAVTGREVSIYFDEVNHPIAASLADITRNLVREANVLVCVLTSAFTERIWCRDEILTFIDGRQAPAVLHVEKLPPSDLQRDRLAETVRSLPPTKLWAGAPPLELEPSSPEYRRAINDLAHKIASKLAVLAEPARVRKAVYVARPAAELHPARVGIERELIDQGYDVQPNDLLTGQASLIDPRVQTTLASCVLSVHLVGTEVGPTPDGARQIQLADWRGPESLVAQQWRLGKAAAANCLPVVWLPTGMNPSDPAQVALVTSIEQDPGSAIIVRGTIADLKQRLIQMLEPPPRRSPAVVASAEAASNAGLNVYLMRDLSDDEGVEELVEKASARAYVLMLPKDGTQQELSDLHEEYLNLAERTLLFWGKSTQAWVQKKLIELDRKPIARSRPRGAFVRDPNRQRSFRFPRGVDVLCSLSDVDRFLSTAPTNPPSPPGGE